MEERMYPVGTVVFYAGETEQDANREGTKFCKICTVTCEASPTELFEELSTKEKDEFGCAVVLTSFNVLSEPKEKEVETLRYGGVKGSIEYSEADGCWHGKILGIDDLISYESNTQDKLYYSFAEAVDEWHKDRCKIKEEKK